MQSLGEIDAGLKRDRDAIAGAHSTCNQLVGSRTCCAEQIGIGDLRVGRLERGQLGRRAGGALQPCLDLHPAQATRISELAVKCR